MTNLDGGQTPSLFAAADGLRIDGSVVLDIVESQTYRSLTFSAVWATFERQEMYAGRVDHDAQAWSIERTRPDPVQMSCRDGILDNGVERHPAATYRTVSARPLMLLFPERLPLWGTRKRDTDEPIRIEALDGGRELVTFQSRTDDAQRKTLVYDRNLGLITRYDDGLSITIINSAEFARRS